MRLEEAFNKNYNRFTENEQYICRYLLEHKKECAVMSITEFAGSCHVSESMLVRFAKKNSLAGYGELKARLRLEEQETEEAMGPGEGLLNTVTDSYHKMMDELIGRGLDSLFEKLYRARRVFLYGSGSAQTRAASEMKRIFLPVKEMFHIHGHDMRGAGPGMELRLRQVPTLSITRLGNKTLASVCDENLYIHSITLPARYGVEYEISTPYFILIEYLYLAYQEFLKRRLDSQQIL